MSCLYEIPADLDKIPFVVSSLMGCGPAATLPVPSVLIFDVSTHLDVGSRINSHGLNVSTGGNFCIWHVAFGNASIRTAVQNAQIQQIHYVDSHTRERLTKN